MLSKIYKNDGFAVCSAVANFSEVRTFRLQNIAKYPSLVLQTFPTVSINVLRPPSFSSLAVYSGQCSLALCYGHSTSKILTMTVYFKRKCTHVTAYETAGMERLLNYKQPAGGFLCSKTNPRECMASA